jgi:hypothetical protein
MGCRVRVPRDRHVDTKKSDRTLTKPAPRARFADEVGTIAVSHRAVRLRRLWHLSNCLSDAAATIPTKPDDEQAWRLIDIVREHAHVLELAAMESGGFAMPQRSSQVEKRSLLAQRRSGVVSAQGDPRREPRDRDRRVHVRARRQWRDPADARAAKLGQEGQKKAQSSKRSQT